MKNGLRGAPYRSRTCGLKIRSLALYPAELRARAVRGNNGFARERKAAYVTLCKMHPSYLNAPAP